MRGSRIIRIITSAILALWGCTPAGNRPSEHVPQVSDSLYTAQAAMLVYGRDPERALTLIDSALVVGNVSPFMADFLRAKVYAHSTVDPRWDEAIALCEDLLQRDSTRADTRSGADHRSNVLQLMMDSYRSKNDSEDWLRCAIELADLNRAWGQETEALRMEAEIGVVFTTLGRRDEGMAKLDAVIGALDEGAPSVDRMDAGIVARKRKIAVLNGEGRPEAVISVAEEIIRKLDDYQGNPSDYAEDSFRLPPQGDDRRHYCDFYRAQAWGFLARAYAMMNPPRQKEARRYLKLFEESGYGRSFGGRKMIAPAWKSLGEWDKLLSFDDEIEVRMGSDTLNTDYAAVLKDRSDAARARGQYIHAFSYLNRYAALQQELDRQLRESDAQEYAARYHAREQERNLEEARAKLASRNSILLSVALLMLIFAAVSFFFARQRHQIKEKNQALVRMINEHAQSWASSRENGPSADAALFRLIDDTVSSERLYVNPSLQRQDIMDRFGISRRTLNELLSTYAHGQSFTAYINAMRIQDAVRLLQEKPDISLAGIAEKVGFTPATFREQFKRQFGMTPTEYRQNL